MFFLGDIMYAMGFNTTKKVLPCYQDHLTTTWPSDHLTTCPPPDHLTTE
jgi:hypothetical protein